MNSEPVVPISAYGITAKHDRRQQPPGARRAQVYGAPQLSWLMLVPAMALLALPALAQQSPLGGAEGGGPVPESGVPAAGQVPLGFPREREGLNLQVSVVSTGGARMGAAGMDWDVPLSYVSWNQTHSRSRPLNEAADGPPAANPDRGPVVVLSGHGTPFVRATSATFKPLRGTQQGELRMDGNDAWNYFDGAGVRYRFERLPGLAQGWPWFLVEVATLGQATSSSVYGIRLSYSIGTPDAREILLTQVAYNHDAAGTCAKDTVVMDYQLPELAPEAQDGAASGTPAPLLLGLAVIDGNVRAHTKLLQAIDVLSRGSDCSTPQIRLSRYSFRYAPDADSGVLRLVAVDVTGREDSAAGTELRPLVRYTYGRTTASTTGYPRLEFLPRATLLTGNSDLGRVAVDDTGTVTESMLADTDGDGLPDYVTDSWWQPNVEARNFGPWLSLPVPLPRLDQSATTTRRGGYLPDQAPQIEDKMAQLVDFNGDGRLDRIATTDSDTWELDLNEPEGWRHVTLHVEQVRRALISMGHELGNVVPLERSATGYSYADAGCRVKVGSQWVPCAGPSVLTTVNEPETTRLMWTLADINGDGYPDLVASNRQARMLKEPTANQPCPCSAASFDACPGVGGFIWQDLNQDPRWCQMEDWRFRMGKPGSSPGTYEAATDDELVVLYNRAGVYPSGLSAPFAEPVRLEGSLRAPLGKWSAQTREGRDYIDSRNVTRVIRGFHTSGSRQISGLIDVNGDGLLDLQNNGKIAIGTGTGFHPVEWTAPTSMRTTTHDFYDVCQASGSQPLDRTTARVVAGYVDVNGDGIPDYLDERNVRFGTGSGLGPFWPVSSPEPVVLSESVSTCGNLTGTQVTAGTWDLDGDGRPEFLRQVGASTVSVASILEPMGGWGALSSGRLVEVDNGYGAVTHLKYRNIKLDQGLPHGLPAPEVLLAEQWTERRNGAPSERMEPTRFAYGGSRMWFDHAADRWTFRGYDRRVALRGMAVPGKGIEGVAVITESLRPEDLSGDVQRNLLTGAASQVWKISGTLPANPEELLSMAPVNPSQAWSRHAIEYGTRTLPLNGQTPDECVQTPQPRALHSAAREHPCRTAAFSYARVQSQRQGRGNMFLQQYTETRTEMASVDDLGRPVDIHHAGDVFRASDDMCEHRVYANPVSNIWPTYTAVSMRTMLEPLGIADGSDKASCQGASTVLASVSYRFDGLPWNSVSVGRRTHDSVTRFNQQGQLLDEWTALAREYDQHGRLTRQLVENGQAVPTVIAFEDWDAFGLHPSRQTTTAPGLAVPMVVQRQLEPYALQALWSQDENGNILTTQMDGWGRQTSSTWVSPADGKKYILSATRYLGETQVSGYHVGSASSEPSGDVLDPAGRRVLHREWNVAVPAEDADMQAAGPAPEETWSYTYLDHMGRVFHRERTLLAEDPASLLVQSHLEFDTLGRVTFQADPHANAADPSVYGSTFLYDPDGRQRCVIRAPGFQPVPETSEADQRYAACSLQSFGPGRRLQTVRGPLENLPGSPVSNAVDEELFDGRGMLLRHSRRTGSAIHEQITYGYDRLGHRTELRRMADPASGLQDPVWTTEYDSLGWPVASVEPGTAPRTTDYDRAGNAIRTSWSDNGHTQTVDRTFDGLGRLVRESEATDGSVDGASVNSYFYDVGAGGPFDPAASYAVGRLTHAHNAAQSIYFGYDPQGRSNYTSWVDPAGVHVEESSRYRLDGQLEDMLLRMPDTGYAEELAYYAYDSAQHLTRVIWADESAPAGKDLLVVDDVDLMGRMRHATYGNGVQEFNTYRDNGPELLQRLLKTGSDILTSDFQYDVAFRVTQQTDGSTHGAGRSETSAYGYDVLGRLQTATTVDRFSVPVVAQNYRHDPLGNRLELEDLLGDRGYTATLDPLDADRLCNVLTQDNPRPGSGCAFQYDAAGNATDTPPLGSLGRHITYGLSGNIRRVELTDASGTPTGDAAAWRYGPLGTPAELVVAGAGVRDLRHDVLFGNTAQRSDLDGREVYQRNIPAGDGLLAIKRGSGQDAVMLFPHGSMQGVAALTADDGDVVQEIVYDPAGGVREDTSGPGELKHTSRQWNGGDTLPDFGVTQLGPRLYDARLGRFLQRDPLVLPASASRANPYAFAWNDPVNFSDPTGYCTENPTGLCWGTESIAGLGAAIVQGVSLLFPDGPQDDMTNEQYLEWARTFSPDPRYAQMEDDAATMSMVGLGAYNATGGAATGESLTQAAADALSGGGVSQLYAHIPDYYRKDGPPTEIGWSTCNTVGLALACHARGGSNDQAIGAFIRGVDKRAQIAVSALEIAEAGIGGFLEVHGANSQWKGEAPMSGCLGGQCRVGNSCFTAGTLVAGAAGDVPIEHIRVGERVRTVGDETCSNSRVMDDADWIEIHLSAPNQDLSGDVIHLVALRTQAWADQKGIRLGETVSIVLDELGFSGVANVDSLQPAERPASGPGCLVMTTETHFSASVLELRFSESTGAVQSTATHPFYSMDRQSWVQAQALAVGEDLRTGEGTLYLASATPLDGLRQVFNLEVDTQHTYLVSRDHLLVHNQCWENWGPGTFGTPEANLDKHFVRHGREVGASTVESYAKKADLFRAAVKKDPGAFRKSRVHGYTENVFRYRGTDKYVDLTLDFRIISFGRNGTGF